MVQPVVIRWFATALVIWTALLSMAVFTTFYWGVAWGIFFMVVLLVVSWLLARRIEREGRKWRDSL